MSVFQVSFGRGNDETGGGGGDDTGGGGGDLNSQSKRPEPSTASTAPLSISATCDQNRLNRSSQVIQWKATVSTRPLAMGLARPSAFIASISSLISEAGWLRRPAS